MQFEIGLITGLMFGGEYIAVDDDSWVIIVDFAFLRFVLSNTTIEDL